jgi:hypothetical protein
MSEDYELAKNWAGESIKAIATGIGGSIFAVAGGFVGVDRFNKSDTYWCYEYGVIHAPPGQTATILDAPRGCTKALMMPIVGPVFSAEAAGTIIGLTIAGLVLIIALITMWVLRKHAP